ncbi:hypothetical protein Tco_0417765 [Tanacetum coccineum]
MMCRRQEYMIRDMERKCVTADKFWKVHGKVDQVLHEIVPQLAERATNDFIEGNLKRVVADTVIQERDGFQADVPALISKEFDAQSPQIIEELFKTYVQNNVIQVHPTTSTSTETTSSGMMHFTHNDMMTIKKIILLLRGEKIVKRHKTSKSSKSAKEETVVDKDEVIPTDETPELITEFQNIDKRVPTIFDRARIEARLNDMLNNQFRNAEDYAYHLEQAKNFMEN